MKVNHPSRTGKADKHMVERELLNAFNDWAGCFTEATIPPVHWRTRSTHGGSSHL